MAITVFSNLNNADRKSAVDRLISGSTASQDFFLMIMLSILVGTFGLIVNDVAVIIGSMLIAPILYPILSLSLGLIMSDAKIISRSFFTFIKATLFAIVTSLVISILFSTQYVGFSEEIIIRTVPTISSVAVAVVAGFAASFALAKPHLNETLPGVAVSVSLIPPLAVVGIGISQLSIEVATGAFLLFLINTIGVMFASMITFSLMNFHSQWRLAEATAIKEDKKIEVEVKEAKKRK